MRKICFLFLINFCLVVSSLSQDNSKWIKLEADDLSISIPPSYIIDSEKRERNQVFRIIGLQNGVAVELKIFEESDPKRRLGNIAPSETFVNSSLKKGDLIIKRHSSKPKSPNFYESLF